MSLPEILVAALLIGIALVPLLELYPGTLGFNVESEIDTVLSAVAVRKMEEIVHVARTVPVAFDASTEAGSAAATTSTCASITISPSANYIVIQIAVRGITAVSSVVVGSPCNSGTAAAPLLTQNNGAATRRSELWGLLNPPTGTVNVQVNMSASVRHSWEAASFKRVLSATPLGSSYSATTTSAVPILTTSPRTANSLLVGGFMWDGDLAAASIAQGTCQTTIDTAASTGGGGRVTTHLAQEADQGDADIDLWWSVSVAGQSWVALAVELRGAAWDQSGTAACPDLPNCRLVWTTACDTSVVAVTVRGAGALRTVSVVACEDTDGNAICDSSERQVRYDAKVTSRR